ncbi:hypothetical protein FHX59_007271 [Paraburkholderia silvatlantica]|uniref:Uncharacterized protein n=1 Tax=Paraburkholderia silvatlantica TaxID=321895 RepID=A0A2U0ZPD3_9BURK|nr:hypothetical protein [Paraburkholderia silvatlantica]PVY20754.1 hypothetical protein C7411_13928 [Paraburkholderia silvatlantica]PXW25194.1 hypothetical protein C7413_14128 [Paraburkholderia silvatlantica]PYE14514.1 hypothetical protein C7410_13853 [Paraburkholderia silvatlantica]TDR04134.1 hypothetical protein C7412_10231 [Paraburkholderia silvatlantica]
MRRAPTDLAVIQWRSARVPLEEFVQFDGI